MSTPRLKPLEAEGQKSDWIFFVLALLNIVDAFNLNIVWPMLPFMVDSYGVAKSEEDLGAWVGTGRLYVIHVHVPSLFFASISCYRSLFTHHHPPPAPDCVDENTRVCPSPPSPPRVEPPSHHSSE